MYSFLVSLIYEERRNKEVTAKLDSRTIPPPRGRSPEERILFSAVSEQIGDVPYIFPYILKNVHSSIYWFKYKRDKYTTDLLSRVLSDEITGMISDRLNINHINKWIVTYAPSTSHHRGEKKWDHNEDIFEGLKKNLNFSFQKIFGFSEEKIKSNKKLSKNERENLSTNKFSLLPEVKIPEDSGLIIFDDVTTTGSTLKNLERIAGKLKPKMILVVAIAH